MPLPPSLEKLTLPVVASPMFIISTPEMVIAQCKAGIVGSFPSLNARPQELLDSWLEKITSELKALKETNDNIGPYAVNLIVHQSNARLEADLETCIKFKVPIIITSLRALDARFVDRIHAYGGLVFHDVINIRHAKKAASSGVDGLILVCAGAGGHAGTLSPFALTAEVRQWFSGTILLAGSIANGQSILSAQALGADLAYIGTRFIASKEANAGQAYKEMLVEHSANDIVYTSMFTGVHGNYLKPSITKSGLDPDNLDEGDKNQMTWGDNGSKAKAWRDVWGAGQGLGSIHNISSIQNIVDELQSEYQQSWSQLNQTVEG